MTKSKAAELRDRLRAMADRVQATIAGLEAEVRRPTGGETAGGLSNAPLHLADVGTEAYNQELGSTLLENETYIRAEAVAALDRMDRGTYGRCENCGKAIPAARLDALPYARHCVPCAEAVGSGVRVNMNRGRPDTWLGDPGHEGATQPGPADRVVGRELGAEPNDIHAAGTPGGGTSVGGLAGTNVGAGAPGDVNLEEVGSREDRDDPAGEDEDMPEATAGPSGGAVGGTPANKRARVARPRRRAGG